MHTDETWQLYQQNGEPIIGSGWDSARDNPEGNDTEIVGVAVVFVFRRSTDGALELLWQKRSAGVSRYPGFYDISAGGHVNLGESLVEAAIRETREEIGAEIGPQDLCFVTERGFNKNRFAWIYAVDWTNHANEFHFDDKEVEEVKWVPFEMTYDFVEKYAKPSLKKDKLTFEALKNWFEMNGYLGDNGNRDILGNYAFIDGQNLIYNTKKNIDNPWVVDLKRFRIYLKEKYHVDKAYYFVGVYTQKYQKLYDALKEYDYDVIFREHDPNLRSSKKGNVDTNIVFLTMKKVAEEEKFDKILLVSGDGDYFRIVNYLIEKKKFEKLLAPSRVNLSSLYRRKIGTSFVDYLDKRDIKRKIILEERHKNAGSP